MKVRPYRNEVLLATTAIDEAVIGICVIVITVLWLNERKFTEEKKGTIGLSLVALILISVSKNFAIIIHTSLNGLRKNCKRKQKKKRHLKLPKGELQRNAPPPRRKESKSGVLEYDCVVEEINQKVKSVVHSVQSNECLHMQTIAAGPDDGMNLQVDEELEEKKKRRFTPRRAGYMGRYI